MWHIFSSTVKWLFIMNFVSNCQFFSLERCNKAHWDPGNLIASNALGLVNMGFAL
ncbi:hypothetical protein [Wolbachia endosymbiont (group A) of Myopa testacea]|uniref:hypothetical protein n=1 Tax=Wolbachia endosymbiont (group A) of Myopa testacea TaxID=3066148 RepID=UPI0033407CEA